MEIKILPASLVKDRMASILKAIQREGVPCFVTQYGRAQAVLLSVAQYNALLSVLEDVEDERDDVLAKRVRQARRRLARGQGIPLRDYFVAHQRAVTPQRRKAA